MREHFHKEECMSLKTVTVHVSSVVDISCHSWRMRESRPFPHHGLYKENLDARLRGHDI